MNDVLPDNAGYVAAAYLVFLVMVLVYVGIMAIRVGRLERELVELNELVDRERARDREPDREPERA